ncbi:MAG: hypothetical protein IKX86_05880 [Clostridia bacterium]|nr:hypothetical protein [Clostridia bacterium]
MNTGYTVDSMDGLVSLVPESDGAIVVVKGYYGKNDGGGGVFWYERESDDTPDGGTVVAGAAPGRFIRSCEPNRLNVRWFGAMGDGEHDDTAAIQSAINALPPAGGVLNFPGGVYCVTKTIEVGDGDAGEKISSRQGIKLVGDGGGFAFSVKASTTIRAAAGIGPVIRLNGRISDCEIAGIHVDCAQRAAVGIYLHSFTGCWFHNVMVHGFTDTGIVVLAGVAPTGNYNIYNRFESVGVFASLDETTCISFDGTYNVFNDTWLTVVTDCRFDTAKTKRSVAAHFKFVDSISFYRCHFNTYDDSSTGAVFDALNNHDFPCGMAFYDCSMVSHKVFEDEKHKIRKQYFYGFGTYDNEQLPSHEKLIGMTDTGEFFNIDPPGIKK